MGQDIVLVRQRRDEAAVDAGRGADLLRRDARRLAGEHARGADAVAADVHQATARELLEQARVARIARAGS